MNERIYNHLVVVVLHDWDSANASEKTYTNAEDILRGGPYYGELLIRDSIWVVRTTMKRAELEKSLLDDFQSLRGEGSGDLLMVNLLVIPIKKEPVVCKLILKSKRAFWWLNYLEP